VTTKVHALTDGLVRPLSLMLSAGQAGDNPVLEPLLETYRGQQNAKRGFTLLADKAYSHPSTRARPLDIDTELDLDIADFLVRRRGDV